MEGQVPQAKGFRIRHPLGCVRADEQLQHRVPFAQHPQIVVLCRAVDLTVEFKSEATEIAAIMETESDVIAVLPQPYVTTVQMQNESVRVALDLTEEWESASGRTLVTGVLVVNADFAAEHPDAVAAFLADYEASVAYTETNPEDTAALIESYGIVPKAAVALKALPYCNITFLGADDMKAALSSYLETLYEQNPASVGGELPDEAFYYGAQ